MKHEINQLENLLKHAQLIPRCELGIPPIKSKGDTDYLLHLLKHLPRCIPPLKRGGIFRVTEETRIAHKGQLLCFVGEPKLGNVVLYIDHDLLTMERILYDKVDQHIDLIRCIRYSDQMTTKLRGHLGEIFKRYRDAVNEIIRDNIHVELEMVSYLSMIHEYVVTGKIVEYNATTW